ncbi:MAG: hypothetical protein II734_04135 [Paludibacteraceae bacterium]|jgi:hypothetical protein|nr:hypothetical protein [Bacteroidales bacterium]MBQ1835933.1 hypothetical protein [Paludibacteraceae bacterium]MBQ3680624.1 hypothetical protein [Paludibacteraceae bacterium]MBQ3681133.1 hypothetical protein [Paludibacteraceae bacterium]MBQ3896276.1 hypothetical protein [Paludibacteraceae bacterium]
MQNQNLPAEQIKTPSLWVAVVLDILGMVTFTIPGVGEFGDVVWAPLSAYLFSRLYGTDKVAKWGAIFNFAEEILPFTDFCPTFTIAWFMRKFSK